MSWVEHAQAVGGPFVQVGVRYVPAAERGKPTKPGQAALVIGDAGDRAFVIEGTDRELAEFAARLSAAVPRPEPPFSIGNGDDLAGPDLSGEEVSEDQDGPGTCWYCCSAVERSAAGYWSTDGEDDRSSIVCDESPDRRHHLTEQAGPGEDAGEGHDAYRGRSADQRDARFEPCGWCGNSPSQGTTAAGERLCGPCGLIEDCQTDGGVTWDVDCDQEYMLEFTDTERCDECGSQIPASEPAMVNKYHLPSCSLHPER